MKAPHRKAKSTKQLAQVYNIVELSHREELALERFLRREGGETVLTDSDWVCATNSAVDTHTLAKALARLLLKKGK